MDSKSKNIAVKIIGILFLLMLIISCEKEVSVSPPDLPPPNGFVRIETKPGKFQIFMDGKDRRRITPDSITWLKTGKYNFTLKRVLYRDSSFTMDVVEGEKKKIFIDYSLNPTMHGRISVVSKPTGSIILVNDSNTALRTPATVVHLLPDYYNLKLTKENHRAKTIVVPVESNKTTNVEITLVDTTIWQDYTTTNSSFRSNNLSCIERTPSGTLLIGTYDEGMITLDGSGFRSFNQNNSKVIDREIRSIFVLSDQQSWISSKYGIGIFYRGDFSLYFDKDSHPPTKDIYISLLSSDLITYMSTPIGLMMALINPITKTMDFRLPSSKSVIKPGWFITGLKEDSYKNLWIATEHNGIYKISETDTTVFKKLNSLIPTDNITSACLSHDGSEIYFSHDPAVANAPGVSVFENGFKTSYALNYPELRTKSIYISRDKRIWVASSVGIITFTNYSNIKVLNQKSTGFDLDLVTGISEDAEGNIYFSTNGLGLIKLRNNKIAEALK